MNTERTPQPTDNAQETVTIAPEQRDRDLEAMFGSGVTSWSESSKNALYADDNLKKRALKLEQLNPAEAAKLRAQIGELVDDSEKEDGDDNLDQDSDDIELPKSRWKRMLNFGRYYYSKPWIWMASRSDKYRDRYEAASPEERAKMERKANIFGTIGAVAVGVALYGMKSTHMFGLMGGGSHNGLDIKDASAGSASHDHALEPKNRVRGPEEYPHLSFETPELSRKNEMNFLEMNGRVHNDFNNISANEIGVSGDKDHFPGYSALHEQYQKSPVELAAQLRQIQAVEMANGHTFDLLPKELQMRPGESQTTYITRLGDAMHADPRLHDKLVDGALDYIKEHGQPLRDLTQNYSANYLVMENGKPVVRFDDFVSSADPNDKVIMLSETEGIRFPCGQPIKLIEQHTVAVAPEQQYQPRGGGSQQHVVSRPRVPVGHPPVDHPPTDNPPTDHPPVDHPPELQPKDPREDINANPDLPEQVQMGDVRMGSGAPQAEHDVVRPPVKYEPKPIENDNAPAPGAKPSTGLFGGGQTQQSGTSTGAASGANNGETAGNVGE